MPWSVAFWFRDSLICWFLDSEIWFQLSADVQLGWAWRLFPCQSSCTPSPFLSFQLFKFQEHLKIHQKRRFQRRAYLILFSHVFHGPQYSGSINIDKKNQCCDQDWGIIRGGRLHHCLSWEETWCISAVEQDKLVLLHKARNWARALPVGASCATRVGPVPEQQGRQTRVQGIP